MQFLVMSNICYNNYFYPCKKSPDRKSWTCYFIQSAKIKCFPAHNLHSVCVQPCNCCPPQATRSHASLLWGRRPDFTCTYSQRGRWTYAQCPRNPITVCTQTVCRETPRPRCVHSEVRAGGHTLEGHRATEEHRGFMTCEEPNVHTKPDSKKRNGFLRSRFNPLF